MGIFQRKGKVTVMERLHDPVKDYDTSIFLLEPVKERRR